MNLMDWIGQNPHFAQRFEQFQANHPGFSPQMGGVGQRMQYRGPMMGGNTPSMQMPPVMTGGQGQRMPMFNPQMGGDGQRFPVPPRMPMGQPADGGYDSSGINPNGMYTGGNQRPGMGGLQSPRLMGLRRY